MKTRGSFSWALRAGLLLSLAVSVAVPVRAQSGSGSNTSLPVLVLRVKDAEASEPGANEGRFEIFRDGPTNLALHAFLEISGSASNGVDYLPLPTWIPVPAGVRAVPIPVKPIDDALAEEREDVAVRLVYPPLMSPLPLNYTIGSPSNGVVKIFDNDPPVTNLPPVVTVRATDPEAAEPGVLTVVQSGEFTFSRTGPTEFALPVFFKIAGTAGNGLDYESISNTVVIPLGEASAKVKVNPLHDLLPEHTETVVVRIETPACIAIYPPPRECYEVGTPAEAVVKIFDNDPPPTNRPPEVKLTKPLDGQTFVLPEKVTLRADAVDADGYVPHVEFYAGDVKIGEETRMFFVAPPPGQHHVFETVWTNPPVGRHVLSVKAQDDGGAAAWSAPVNIWVVRTNEPPVTNRPPVVTITAPDALASEGTNHFRWCDWAGPTGSGAGRTNAALFVIRRSGPTNDSLTVHYHIGGSASNGVDYLELPGTATLAAGRRAVEIRVVPIDDSQPERLETVVLGLRVPADTASNVPPYLVGYPRRAAAVIVDNDQPRPATGQLPDRCFHIMRPGSNGNWFRIEWSSDMVNWTPFCTNSVVDSALHFVDPDAEDAPQRFYRAVPESAPPGE